jgi:hypothetical protein
MDLYVAAAFKAEQTGNPERGGRTDPEGIKEAYRACTKALMDLNAHRKEHGC